MFFRTLLLGALRKLLSAIIHQKIFQHFWNSFNNLMGAIIHQKNGTNATSYKRPFQSRSLNLPSKHMSKLQHKMRKKVRPVSLPKNLAAKVVLIDQIKKLAKRLVVADNTMELKLHVSKLLCQVCPRPTQTMPSP